MWWLPTQNLLVKKRNFINKRGVFNRAGWSEELYTATKDHNNYDACAFIITILYNILGPVVQRKAPKPSVGSLWIAVDCKLDIKNILYSSVSHQLAAYLKLSLWWGRSFFQSIWLHLNTPLQKEGKRKEGKTRNEGNKKSKLLIKDIICPIHTLEHECSTETEFREK